MTDVNNLFDITNHWAKECIEYCVNSKLFSGTSAYTFSPDAAITRGMFVTVLGRFADVDPSYTADTVFEDVDLNAYFTPYINWAKDKGLVSGMTSTTFLADESITREQMAVLISNYFDLIGFELPQIYAKINFQDDYLISDYAKNTITTMQQAGILFGRGDGIFDPQATTTRAETAAIMLRLSRILGK